MPPGSSPPKLSAMSDSLATGRTTAAIRARLAPSTFSRMPPTGSTVLASVSSQVIATPLRTGCPVGAETSAAASATPADGPSFHRAGLRQVHVHVRRVVRRRRAGEAFRVRAHPRHRDVCRFSHHRPARPGDVQPPAARRHAASTSSTSRALAGHCQTQGDAGAAGPGRDLLVAEPRRPEPRGHRFRSSPGSGSPSARSRAARAAEPVDAIVEETHARFVRGAPDQELEGGRRERHPGAKLPPGGPVPLIRNSRAAGENDRSSAGNPCRQRQRGN